MHILDHRVDTAPDVRDGPEISKVGPLHPRNIAFVRRQHHFARRIFRFIGRFAPRLEEAEMIKEFAEGDAADTILGQLRARSLSSAK